ncbi:MAG TPA: IclR family transcriptional regulator [Steroidobacteraceae bacterium]|nr:IclR family transcriptional regulator [Steroidobacteraceae bacterium]
MNRVLSIPAEVADIAAETSSTLKAFGVLEVLVRAGRAVTLSELMQATDLPKPTLHRTLALFEEAGFLAREPGGRAYIIGERLSRFALDVLRSDGAAAQRRTILRRVVSEITETCNLAVLKKAALVYLDRVEAPWPLRLYLPEGGGLPPHCCASGKLLLAHLPAAERQGLLELLPLERFTERTITDRAVLDSELDRIVSVGYAVDNEEYVLGVACVAVPVRNRHGDVVASLAVQGATARLPLMRAIEFIPRLRAAAAEIGSTFG